MPPSSLYLLPPLIPPDGQADFIAQNRTVSVRLSARSHGLAAFESVNVLPPPPGSERKEGSVYFVQWDSVPALRRKFITDTYVVYDAFRASVEALRNDRTKKQHGTATIAYYHTICSLYTETIRKQIISYETRLTSYQKAAGMPQAPDQRTVSELTRETSVLGIVYTSLSLMQTIFVPSHGAYNAVVGRELLHWLNTNFLVTMEEEGMSLLKINNPWLNPNFWTFIKSCTLRLLFRPATHFLSTLAASSNIHPATREISALLVAALNGMPNSEDYDREADYFDAHRLWKTNLHRLQRAVAKHASAPPPPPGAGAGGGAAGAGGGSYEGKAELEELVALVGGDPRALVDLSHACGMSWRDAICVYGIWIQPSMTRKDLPGVVAEIIEDMPVDPTSSEEQLYAALFASDPARVARLANDIDIWLVTHMVDMLETLGLPEHSTLVNLRLYFLLSYGEHLMADPSNWRVACSYLSHCGEQGLGMINEFLLTLPFRISNIEEVEGPVAVSQAVAVRGKKKKPAPVAELDEILAFCTDHNLHATIRGICRVASRRLTEMRLYGKAVEYCAKTADSRALNRVVGALSNEYLLHGSEEFVLLVDKIPSIFLYPPKTKDLQTELFTNRLGWLVTYAEHHFDLSRGKRTQQTVTDLAGLLHPEERLCPKGWWGLVLVDIGDFLETGDVKPTSEDLTLILIRLEEVCTRSKVLAVDDYLWALMRRYGMKSTTEALARLERVRFTLVVCAAKTLGGDAGGKGNILDEKMNYFHGDQYAAN